MLGLTRHNDDASLLSEESPAAQDRRTVVVLDEFEKLKDLTSALGWDQVVYLSRYLSICQYGCIYV